MDTKPKIKQIQLLGSTFVSGYFAFAELVNYNQFNQHKIIKPFEKGNFVQYGDFGMNCLNVIKQDDTRGSCFIKYGIGTDAVKMGYYNSNNRPCVIPVPNDFDKDIFLVDGICRVYKSSNKSFSKYIVLHPASSLWVGADLYSYAIMNNPSSDNFVVCYIDMCINTTEPITFNYVGEAQFIQNSNIDNNFTPLFKINRYDYNCF